MPLIKCPDCGQVVSDRSITCLKCGRPIAEILSLGTSSSVQTIEKTSKKLKGWLAVCYSTFFVALMAMFVGGGSDSMATVSVGFLFCMAGAAGIVWVKFKIWWEHK